jgi:hypothetical protein
MAVSPLLDPSGASMFSMTGWPFISGTMVTRLERRLGSAKDPGGMEEADTLTKARTSEERIVPGAIPSFATTT